MKTMKKSMFLTTVLMVVLLVVALSTATFAWYTAQSSVNVTATTAHSAQSGAASLAIDTTANVASDSSQISITLHKNIEPMIPAAKPTGSTTYTEFSASGAFKTSPVDNAGKFVRNGDNTVAAHISQVNGAAQATQDFYVINTNTENTATVNAAVTFNAVYTLTESQPADWASHYGDYYTQSAGVYSPVTGESAPSWAAETYYSSNIKLLRDLRVAMFVDNTYLATWSFAGANCYYGTITATQDAVTSVTPSVGNEYTTLASAATQSIGTLAAAGNANIKLVVWFDGVGLVNDESNQDVTFALSFTIAA